MNPQLQKDIFQWDVKSWSNALPFWQKQIDLYQPKTALAIGEREGGLSLWLALQGIQITCSDLNAFPPHTAELHANYGVSDKIVYEEQDATNLKCADNTYDLVIFKSVIGALSKKELQRRAINEMHRVLKPGGMLLFAENLRSTQVHAHLRRRFIPWDKYWRYLHLKEDQDLFSAFRKVDCRSYGLLAALGRSAAQRNILAGFDKLLCPITPATWHYIMYGCCLK